MDTVGPRVFLKEAGKWETIELRFLEIFLIPKQRWREFVIIRLVPCAWRSWLKQSSVPKEWPRGTWKEQKMAGGCCKRPFLFIIDLHWIIWNHESTTGALVCLLPANTTNREEEGGLSALKKFTDIRWIENLRSSAWKLSWLWNSQSEIQSTIWVWRVEYENLALNFFVIRGDMCPNGFYAQKKRSQSDRCTVAFSNIAMF